MSVPDLQTVRIQGDCVFDCKEAIYHLGVLPRETGFLVYSFNHIVHLIGEKTVNNNCKFVKIN